MALLPAGCLCPRAGPWDPRTVDRWATQTLGGGTCGPQTPKGRHLAPHMLPLNS